MNLSHQRKTQRLLGSRPSGMGWWLAVPIFCEWQQLTCNRRPILKCILCLGMETVTASQIPASHMSKVLVLFCLVVIWRASEVCSLSCLQSVEGWDHLGISTGQRFGMHGRCLTGYEWIEMLSELKCIKIFEVWETLCCKTSTRVCPVPGSGAVSKMVV